MDELVGGPNRSSRPTVGRGVVVDAPSGPNSPMRVKLANFGNLPYEIPGTNWMMRPGRLPQVGDRCLVVFDDEGDAHVPSWRSLEDPTEPTTGQGLVWTPGLGWLPTDVATQIELNNVNTTLTNELGDEEAARIAADAALDARLDVLEDMVLFVKAFGVDTRASTSYGDPVGGPGPAITMPRAGEWVIEMGAYLRTNTSGTSAVMSVQVGAAAALDADGAQVDVPTANNGMNSSGATSRVLSVGTVLATKLRATGGVALWRDPWIKATLKV